VAAARSSVGQSRDYFGADVDRPRVCLRSIVADIDIVAAEGNTDTGSMAERDVVAAGGGR